MGSLVAEDLLDEAIFQQGGDVVAMNGDGATPATGGLVSGVGPDLTDICASSDGESTQYLGDACCRFEGLGLGEFRVHDDIDRGQRVPIGMSGVQRPRWHEPAGPTGRGLSRSTATERPVAESGTSGRRGVLNARTDRPSSAAIRCGVHERRPRARWRREGGA